MNEFAISMEFVFFGPSTATNEQFGRFIDCVMQEFEKISDSDLSIAATLSERVADFSALVPAGDKDEALSRFLVDTRTALHAVGCATPQWPFVVSEQRIRTLEPA